MRSAQTYIEIVHDRGKRNLPLQRVYRNLQNWELFLMAYGKIYANKGATTPGIDPNDTVDGMSLGRIDEIIQNLKQGTYQWQPVRRTNIPKKNGQTRSLGLPVWTDKLLQQVIKMVLEAYYEPKFSKHSHGFRPNRGCHTALREIYTSWNGTKWFIEGDIKGFYDNIVPEVLLGIIERDIKDQKFLKLIRQLLKAGYMANWEFHQTYSGVPQGAVLSPLLANLVLNELDHFVETELLPQYNKGTARRPNLEYARLSSAMKGAKEQGDAERYKQLKKQRQQLPTGEPQDPNYRRLRYCRYGDDFILGYVGTRQEAAEVKQKIQDFLSTLKLSLSEEKTLITHATSERARFLNYEIYIGHDNTKLTNHKREAKRIGRSLNGKVILSVPREVTQKWQTRFTKNAKAIHHSHLLRCSDYEIVQTYNLEFQGLVNYYTMAHNVSKRMGGVKYQCQQSLTKTLAAKHKQNVTWVYRKYYRQSEQGLAAFIVTTPNPNNPDKPLTAQFGGKSIQYNPKTTIKDTIPKIHHGLNELVRRLQANKCELCGSSEKINVHHIHKLKDIKKKYKGYSNPPAWVKFMIARNRKTVVVCHQCHVDIHTGRYDGKKVE